MPNPDAASTLRLFNEKAEKLEGLSFTKYLLNGGQIGFTGSVQDDGSLTLESHGPSAEAIDAFVLTLRFFVQDNELTSFRNMEALYRTLPIDKRVIDNVVGGRATINGLLDSPSHIVIKGDRPANRQIFEVFLWGGLAHANPKRKAEFDAWRERPELVMVLQMEFTSILAELLDFISWMRGVNYETLTTLGA